MGREPWSGTFARCSFPRAGSCCVCLPDVVRAAAGRASGATRSTVISSHREMKDAVCAPSPVGDDIRPGINRPVTGPYVGAPPR